MSDVPEGYKMSEAGVVPEEWEVKQFGDFAYLSKNYLNPQHSKKSYPCVELEHLTQETGLLLGFVESKEQLSQKLIFSRGDVLFGKLRPYLKKFYFAEFDGVCTSEIWVIKSYNNAIGQFIFHLIQSNHFLETANQTSGTKMPRADWKIVSCTPFPLPPIPEQQAIASALSDVDALITALEQLITKKRNIKQGAMQQLLTGEKRLPGFGGGWEVKKLGEILKVRHGKSQKSVNNENGLYPILATGGEIGRADAFLYDKPSVLIGRKGTIDVPQYMETPFWTIDTLFFTEISDNTNPKYIFYKFNLIDWYSHNEASGVPSMNASTIEKIELLFPPTIEEQQAIAHILSDMDTEIESLEQKQAKYKAIKQGMMQELLTGKTRLV